jgi:hypothetical protein
VIIVSQGLSGRVRALKVVSRGGLLDKAG